MSRILEGVSDRKEDMGSNERQWKKQLLPAGLKNM